MNIKIHYTTPIQNNATYCFKGNPSKSRNIVLLVVEPTHLKNMNVKMGSSSPIFGMKIKNIWNHQPDYYGDKQLKNLPFIWHQVWLPQNGYPFEGKPLEIYMSQPRIFTQISPIPLENFPEESVRFETVPKNIVKKLNPGSPRRLRLWFPIFPNLG